MGLGLQELLIVLVIVILSFGAGKLPELGGALGRSIKEFKAEADEGQPGPIAAATDRRDEGKVMRDRDLRADNI
jgi:sec-independent protein translocase protein TatA